MFPLWPGRSAEGIIQVYRSEEARYTVRHNLHDEIHQRRLVEVLQALTDGTHPLLDTIQHTVNLYHLFSPVASLI